MALRSDKEAPYHQHLHEAYRDHTYQEASWKNTQRVTYRLFNNMYIIAEAEHHITKNFEIPPFVVADNTGLL